ncbi:MAG: DUF4339 domain-containing protein [Gloeobacteraceae cyanobacterium ES-bin-144]|nr:DUF4339 domain-containing protein [Verrucomicrobiales bacterium]
MSEVPQDAWFYTREGETIGPVTFSDLRVKVQEAALNPRLDMVWTQGMEAWKPAGEIEDLFEKRTGPVVHESLAPPADPYTPPNQLTDAERMSGQKDWPGARRRSYIFVPMILGIIGGLILPKATVLMDQQFGPRLTAIIVMIITFLPMIAGVYFSVMRLANLGMSRWWFFGNFVPLLNVWICYRCFACPAGYAYHKKLDGIGWILAIIYWLTVLLALVVFVLIIAMTLGAIHDPEIRGKLNEIMSAAQQRAAKP